MSLRLSLALSSGVDLGSQGSICVLHPRRDVDLSDLPRDRAHIVQPFAPDHAHFVGLGFSCSATLPDDARFSAALVFLTRSRDLNRDLIARAAAQTDGVVLVDGAKTDGIDSLLKALRKTVSLSDPIAKAHGKVAWFESAQVDLADWRVPPKRLPDGFVTAPGVFSADGVDPASALLRDALPSTLGAQVADFGAGWGFLSAHVAKRPGLEALHLVEADHTALDCARLNVVSDKAKFHWADATEWSAPTPLDTVVMNPPFHTSRAAEPALGQAFIANAARNLAPKGQLWMVANRHLPYEDVLQSQFARCDEIGGDRRFKLLHAQRPKRARK